MKIENYEKLKFTKVKKNGGVVHFKYDNEDYTLINGYVDYTACMRLYKGRCKGNLEDIKNSYGMSLTLIKYIHPKKTLKYIDKENFVLELVLFDLLDPTEEQKKLVMKKEYNKLIKTLEDDIRCFEWNHKESKYYIPIDYESLKNTIRKKILEEEN